MMASDKLSLKGADQYHGIEGAEKPSSVCLDIVIPSRNESQNLNILLFALLKDIEEIKVHIIIVLNGDNFARTREMLHVYSPWLHDKGHRLSIIETSKVGKPSALNVGDEARNGGPVIYLDADAIPWPGTINSIASATSEGPPKLVGVRRQFIPPKGYFARRYIEIWSRRPANIEFIGGGCFAVNSAGRTHWDEFPSIIADDAYVFQRFAPENRVFSPTGGIWVTFPTGFNLLRTIKRWKRGNQQVHPRSHIRRNIRQELVWLWRMRPKIIALVIFLGMHSVAELTAIVSNKGSWIPIRCESEPKPKQTISLLIIIVSYNSAVNLKECLDSIRVKWADAFVIVVDNDSIDDSHEIAQSHPNVHVALKNKTNVGFARAVNQAASFVDSEKILLLNPDVVLSDDTIDCLVALSLKMPGSGFQGGRCLDSAGNLDPTSVLGAASFFHALAFALMLSVIPVLRRIDPDRMWGWERDGTREVDILTGAVLLVDREAWQKLGGFEENYFLYGEDVDLCMRAKAIGFRPHFTDIAVYQHIGGASSPNEIDRMVRILGGKANLYKKYVPRTGIYLLLIGVWLRSKIEPLLRKKSRLWESCWNRRQEWLPN